MPSEFERSSRVADLLQREIAQILQRDIQDPALGMMTVTVVKMSPNLRQARIYLTFIEPEDANPHSDAKNSKEDPSLLAKNRIAVLKNHMGFIKKLLAGRLKLRFLPELTFVHDNSLARGNALSSLIEQATKSVEDSELSDEASIKRDADS